MSRGEEAFLPVSWLRHGVSRRHGPSCCVAWGRFQHLPSPSPLLLPGVWDTADDGAEHEGCDKGEEGQVDEALDAIVAEACEGLHVVLRAGGNGGGDTERETGKHRVR